MSEKWVLYIVVHSESCIPSFFIKTQILWDSTAAYESSEKMTLSTKDNTEILLWQGGTLVHTPIETKQYNFNTKLKLFSILTTKCKWS